MSKTSTGAVVGMALLIIFRTLAKLMLLVALVSFLIWWLVPLATAGAVVLTPLQAVSITGLLYIYHATQPTRKD
jgi:flagellar biogenesis protein FliO